MRYFEVNEPQKRVADALENPEQPGMLLYWNVGSGKTIGAINAANRLKAKSTVVVPASLQENFKKELRKIRTPDKNFDIMSYEKFVRTPTGPNRDMLIVDEAHRIRELGTKRSKAVRDAVSKFNKIVLLTGTPIVNRPFDIVPLINAAAKSKRLPETEKEFNEMYVSKNTNYPGFFGSVFLRKKPKTVYDIKNKDKFIKQTGDVVDYYNGMSPEDYPTRRDVMIRTPMSETQADIYSYYEKQLPHSLKKKIQESIAPDRQEVSKLNAFLSATRQLSTSSRAFSTAQEESPKIKSIVDAVKNEKGPSVVYSNYLESGITPIAKELEKNKIPHGVFTGKQTSKQKKDLVDRYNSGQMKALLISSSGGEGLDLKNTSAVHITEPHWNDPKIEQVIGRAIRYKSHKNPAEVTVYKYISTFPKAKSFLGRLFDRSNHKTVDDYLYNLSEQKKELNNKFTKLLR